MHIVTRAHTRPSTDISFFYPKDIATLEFKKYFLDTYITTGKSIVIEHSHSDDNLTMTSTSMWDSVDSFNQFINDPVCNGFIGAAIEYNNNNGITETVTATDV
jgi:hypothetical protein